MTRLHHPRHRRPSIREGVRNWNPRIFDFQKSRTLVFDDLHDDEGEGEEAEWIASWWSIDWGIWAWSVHCSKAAEEGTVKILSFFKEVDGRTRTSSRLDTMCPFARHPTSQNY